MRNVFRAFLIASLGIVAVSGPAVVVSAQGHALHKTDLLKEKLAARVAAIDAKLAAAHKKGRVSAAEAGQIQKKLGWIRTDSARYVKQQGFLSAGESASYNRTLDAIERKLG